MSEFIAPKIVRDEILDAMRTFAFILMAMAHASRLAIHAFRPSWSPLILLTEPYIQAMFLTLVGASLGFSRNKQRSSKIWMKKRTIRALQLYFVAIVMFFFERGIQWPYTFIAPGILYTIAVALLLFSALTLTPWPRLTTLFAVILFIGIHIGLDLNHISIQGINASNAPLLPCIIFSGFGALIFPLLNTKKSSTLWTLAILSLLTFILTLWFVPFHDLFSKPLGRIGTSSVYLGKGDGLTVTWNMIQGNNPLKHIRVRYYNMRPIIVPFLMAMTVSTWLFFFALQKLPKLPSKIRTFLWIPGRNALELYVLHLALLSLPILILGKMHPFQNSFQINTILFSVLLFCWIYGYFREKLKNPMKFVWKKIKMRQTS